MRTKEKRVLREAREDEVLKLKLRSNSNSGVNNPIINERLGATGPPSVSLFIYPGVLDMSKIINKGDESIHQHSNSTVERIIIKRAYLTERLQRSPSASLLFEGCIRVCVESSFLEVK